MLRHFLGMLGASLKRLYGAGTRDDATERLRAAIKRLEAERDDGTPPPP